MTKQGLAWQGPILDNHFHLNRNGRYLDAADDFKKAGGTNIVLIHCPDFSAPPTTRDGHKNSYQNTLDMADAVRNKLGIGVRVVLGPHPAAFAHQFIQWVEKDGEHGKQKAIDNYRTSIDEAVKFYHEGKAHAIGEVGRPHWEVSEEIWELSNNLLLETMKLAASDGFALQLHVEGELESTYRDMAAMASEAGLAKNRLIRHYSPPNVDSVVTQGLTPSVLIGKGALEKLVETAQKSSHGFLLETDYMDDLRRPGAVLGPKTVPKRTQQLVAAGIDEEFMWKAHVDLPNSLYGED
ncbi:MAG: TatD family hydrolase [Candidatus Thermoplasmatota archaeon]|nr:TatD family hydrolase [Candidatus Thermoplasmatota archaeon]MEC7255165.1 TatD family hydrolase [Candidatus Thermoplasmatota archaeon]MEC8248962.1 TatD family hydrolase [Candidatus Thermoplasmatota archaeon]MEC8257857.1 TatD family hydrolase [Candidatus Thermoplasmatota archaeon]MEC8313020.1 TatD family hydrolase [Candidatus Thermoplasmatota archaeon]